MVTYSAAINACARQKRWREALGLLYEMRRDVRTRLNPMEESRPIDPIAMLLLLLLLILPVGNPFKFLEESRPIDPIATLVLILATIDINTTSGETV